MFKISKRLIFIINYFIMINIFIIISILFMTNKINLNYYLIYLFVTIGFFPIFISFFYEKNDIFKPSVLLPFTYTLYAMGPLIGNTEYNSDIVLKYLLFQFLGLISLYIGIYLGLRYKKIEGNVKINENRDIDNLDELQIANIILLLLSILSILTQLHAFGGLTGLFNVGYGGKRFLILKNSNIIGSGFDWLLLSAIIFWFIGIKKDKKSIYLFSVIIGCIDILILLRIGGRSSIIYGLIFFIYLYNKKIRQIPNKVIILALSLGLSIAEFYNFARFFLPQGLITAVIDTYKIVIKKPELILPWNVREFRSPAASLLEILKYGGPNFQFGRTYITAITNTLPIIAKLFSSIGFDPNVWRLKTFYPDLYYNGGGAGFSPVTEGYINFGIIGIFLHMFFYGLFAGKIYKYTLNNNKTFYLLLFAGSLPIFMLDGMRINTASAVYKLFRTYLIPWILYMIILFLKKEKRNVVKYGEKKIKSTTYST